MSSFAALSIQLACVSWHKSRWGLLWCQITSMALRVWFWSVRVCVCMCLFHPPRCFLGWGAHKCFLTCCEFSGDVGMWDVAEAILANLQICSICFLTTCSLPLSPPLSPPLSFSLVHTYPSTQIYTVDLLLVKTPWAQNWSQFFFLLCSIHKIHDKKTCYCQWQLKQLNIMLDIFHKHYMKCV